MPTITVQRQPSGSFIDAWNVIEGPVRIAIVAESAPDPVLLKGALPADVPLAVIGRLIQECKANQHRAAGKSGKKGGL